LFSKRLIKINKRKVLEGQTL